MQCSACNAANPEGKRFCGDCGEPLQANQSGIRHLVEQEISARLKDQKLVELETSQAIISRLMDWAKIFGYAIGIPLTLLGLVLGFLGVKSYSDFSKFSTLVETAKKEAADRIQQAKKENDELVAEQTKLRGQLEGISQVSEDLQAVSKRLDRLEKLAFEPSSALTPALQKSLQASFDAFQSYLRTLGYNSKTEKVSIYVDPTLKDNSFYSDGRIVIGKPFAEDQDVIFREYTHHALTESIPGGVKALSGVQLSGVESGFGDYYPCSFKNDPIFGAKAAQVLKTLYGPSQFPHDYIRTLVDGSSLDQLPASQRQIPTQIGAVWGGAFWQIRNLLGKDTADKLLFDSWLALQAQELAADDPSFFVQHLVDLDRVRRGRRDLTQIRSILEQRRLPLAKVRW
jgi:hypothetical protein